MGSMVAINFERLRVFCDRQTFAILESLSRLKSASTIMQIKKKTEKRKMSRFQSLRKVDLKGVLQELISGRRPYE